MLVHRNSDRHDIVRVVAEIHMQHAHKALDRYTRSGQQQQREGDLTRNQDRVKLFSSHAAGNFSRTRLHDLADFGARQLKRRKEPEKYSGNHGKSDTEQQHGHVYVEVRFVRKGPFRQAGDDEAEAPVGEKNAEARSGERQDQ